jgi:hypothetical protein
MKRRSGWTLLGIVIGAVIVPGAALAAFTDVRVVGVFGSPPAAVTAANQLRVAEIDPAQIRHYRLTSTGDSCLGFPIPAGNSFMVRTLEIDAYSTPTPNAASTIYIRPTSNCSGPIIAEVTPLNTRQTDTITLDPGYPIPAGGGISVSRGNVNMAAILHVNGYLMPSAAVPAGVATAQAKGTGKEAAAR